jgi:hypothetical protein
MCCEKLATFAHTSAKAAIASRFKSPATPLDLRQARVA